MQVSTRQIYPRQVYTRKEDVYLYMKQVQTRHVYMRKIYKRQVYVFRNLWKFFSEHETSKCFILSIQCSHLQMLNDIYYYFLFLFNVLFFVYLCACLFVCIFVLIKLRTRTNAWKKREINDNKKIKKKTKTNKDLVKQCSRYSQQYNYEWCNSSLYFNGYTSAV